MDVSLNLHPQFIIENSLKMLRLLVEDQDLRYREFRNHLIFQIQALAANVTLSPVAHERLKECVLNLSESTDKLSWLDQSLIAECHERWRLTQSILQLERLSRLSNSNQSARLKASHDRVKLLLTQVSELKLEKDPSWLQLLIFRWNFEPLYRESEYLVKVLDQSH
jgi:hypothetical protein